MSPKRRFAFDRPRSVVRVATMTAGVSAALAVGSVAAFADVSVDPVPSASTTVLAPDAPLTLTVTSGDGQLVVAWTAPLSDGGSAITDYVVTAAPTEPASTAPAATATVDPAAMTATLTGLADGVDYTVAVHADNVAGPGSAAQGDATPRTTPGAPAAVAAAAADGSASVHWQPPASDGGAPITGYAVSTAAGVVQVIAPNATSATVTGLADGIPATLSVTTLNVAGSSAASTAPTVVPRKPAALSVATAAVTKVTYGATSTVVARLRAFSGAAIAGRRVGLLYRIGSGAYRTAAGGTTGSTGLVTLHAKMPANVTLALSHPTDAVVAANVTAGYVHVAHAVSTSTGRAIRLGQTVVRTGFVAPARAVGARVLMQKWTGIRWVNVAAGRMTTHSAYRVA